jgi:hypothetical protein
MVELIIIHSKCRFGNVRMLIRTLLDLDPYPTLDQKQMKTIAAKYGVIMGYWALKNNM